MRDKKLLGTAFLVLVLLTISVGAAAQSLYPTDAPSMFEDRKARRWRFVTVIIVEQATARQTASTSAERF